MKLQSLLIAATLAFALTACGKITAENFAKIDSGMARPDVVKILGEPDKTDSSSLLGISGENAVWEAGSTTITLRLVNGVVVTKDLQKR
ncbi:MULTISPECIES: DUF3862 domain-containing protein [Silvimonas]|uniref:DUF3862 domain-containing protein n=1 Tax=Silvimonas TaxID=300264 RepID=UPI0024B33B96|nr:MULTISPECIES: DUF3862 domain-containing protein [Silvimonas]MDR3426385.1 DUF3862 domain-containing protein [Silvimonas sp.]